MPLSTDRGVIGLLTYNPFLDTLFAAYPKYIFLQKYKTPVSTLIAH